MEGLSLLKYWRSGGGTGTDCASPVMTKNTTTIATTVPRQSTDSDVSVEEDEEEGQFFDLEFTAPDEEVVVVEEEEEEGDVLGKEEIEVMTSPSDGLFFKGRLVQLESTSSASLLMDDNTGKQHQLLAGSIFKSATKFRLFTMKGLKKPKSVMPAVADPTSKLQQQGSKFFAVKFKMEDVPIVSFFVRNNSSERSERGVKQSDTPEVLPVVNVMVGVRRGNTPKDVVDKYMNKIKPLHVMVSRRSNGEKSKPLPKLKPTGDQPEKLRETKTSLEKKATRTHLPDRVHNGLRAAKKHLGKSRLASSAVAAVPSTAPTGLISRHRDDSLVQQQDGIQSAIAHCKRSFNATAE